MKRYFVACIALLLGLAAASHAQITNLQLILEGPFAVCENTSGILTIYVPNLQGSHYLAGLSTELDSFVPQIKNDSTEYLSYPDNILYAMHIQPRIASAPRTPMVLKQQNLAPFYSETGTCLAPNIALTSFSIQVPVADEVLPENPMINAAYVHEHPKPGVTTPTPVHGPHACSAGCPYATRIVLRYLDVKADNICLQLMSDTNPCKTPGAAWNPVTAGAITEQVGSASVTELKIELSAEPVAGQDYEDHARRAFRTASNVAGVQRDIVFPPLVDSAASAQPKSRMHGRSYPFMVTTHRVCQVPLLFVCTSGTACTQ